MTKKPEALQIVRICIESESLGTKDGVIWKEKRPYPQGDTKK